MSDDLIIGEDGLPRCWWAGHDPQYQHYHDNEWGKPVTDDIRLFEKICLEGFQAGLSWLTILRKRENFRTAFDGFDFEKVSLYGPAKIEELVQNAGIIRHRGKIESTINNANRALEIVEEFYSLSNYFGQFQPDQNERPATYDRMTLSQLSYTPTSTKLSKNLKKRGWSFVGPTTCYAFMQAMGLVNDHVEGCHCRHL
ncbi:MAG: DNA-3-methyladenine glycosylase I [Alphaproteobacteria bacterium]|nr:DNA-3-methyladenine glycosylase I [Alphaproteobacteria bacterium]